MFSVNTVNVVGRVAARNVADMGAEDVFCPSADTLCLLKKAWWRPVGYHP